MSLPILEVVHLICVSRASPNESKTTFLVPESSLEDFWDQECPSYTFMKLYIDFHVSNYLEVLHLIFVSRVSPKESKRTFLVPERSLRGFLRLGMSFLYIDEAIYQFLCIRTLEVVHLICVSRASPKESKKTFLGGV